MAQYPTVYNQNAGEDGEGGIGLDLGAALDDDEIDTIHSEYADGDEEAKIAPKEVEVASK